MTISRTAESLRDFASAIQAGLDDLARAALEIVTRLEAEIAEVSADLDVWAQENEELCAAAAAADEDDQDDLYHELEAAESRWQDAVESLHDVETQLDEARWRLGDLNRRVGIAMPWLARVRRGADDLDAAVASHALSNLPAYAIQAAASRVLFVPRPASPRTVGGRIGELALVGQNVFDLGAIADNFPYVDLLTVNAPISVKSYEATVIWARDPISAYVSDLQRLKHAACSPQLRDGWATLRDLVQASRGMVPAPIEHVIRQFHSPELFAEWIRDAGTILVPADHFSGLAARLSANHPDLLRRAIKSPLTSTQIRAATQLFLGPLHDAK